MEKKKCDLSPVVPRKRINRGVADFNSLPEEVVVKIFEYLHQKELGKIALVCRRWNKWTRCPILWKKVDLDLAYNQSRNEAIVNLFKRLPSCVTHIRLNFSVRDYWTELLQFQELCVRFQERLLHLKILVLYHAKLKESLSSFIALCGQYLPNLKVLALPRSYFTFDKYNPTAVRDGGGTSSIEVLDISSCSTTVRWGELLFPRLPYLRELHLVNMIPGFKYDSGFEHDISFLTKLKILNLERTEISSTVFQTIQNHASNLTELYLCNTFLNDGYLHFDNPVFPHLTTICLNGCSMITIDSIVSLIQSCQSLQCILISQEVYSACVWHSFFMVNLCKLKILRTTHKVVCFHNMNLDRSRV